MRFLLRALAVLVAGFGLSCSIAHASRDGIAHPPCAVEFRRLSFVLKNAAEHPMEVLLEAKRGCAESAIMPIRYEDVRLTLRCQNSKHVLGRTQSVSALVLKDAQKVILSNAVLPELSPSLGAFYAAQVDLKSGVFSGPGLRIESRTACREAPRVAQLR